MPGPVPARDEMGRDMNKEYVHPCPVSRHQEIPRMSGNMAAIPKSVLISLTLIGAYSGRRIYIVYCTHQVGTVDIVRTLELRQLPMFQRTYVQSPCD